MPQWLAIPAIAIVGLILLAFLLLPQIVDGPQEGPEADRAHRLFIFCMFAAAMLFVASCVVASVQPPVR